MGAQCHSVDDASLPFELKRTEPLRHPLLGPILRLPSDKCSKALKLIECSSEAEMRELRNRAQLLQECGPSISTILQVFQWDSVSLAQAKRRVGQRFDPQQRASEGKRGDESLMVQLQYIAPQENLRSSICSRRASLERMRQRVGRKGCEEGEGVRLFDYEQIDRLPSQQRQVANNFFQEIEVVRMVDHLIGALYFLDHYDIPHGAVRPETILLDREGKYLLVQSRLFRIQTNYQIALALASKQEGKQAAWREVCLPPEQIALLREGVEGPEENGGKGDIFCVGLLALNMCLLSSDCTSPEAALSSDKTLRSSIDVLEQKINEQLNKAKRRYSPYLINLLKKMLKSDSEQRIGFADLIDELSPVLMANLERIKRLHSPPALTKEPSLARDKQDIARKKQDRNSLLQQQIRGIEEYFQKVMARRTLHLQTHNQLILQEEERFILTKLEEIRVKKGSEATKKRKWCPNPQLQSLGRAQTERREAETGHYLSGEELQQIFWQQLQRMREEKLPN